jgi:hypothetical protein
VKKTRRDLIRIIEDEGFTVVAIDTKRGRGSHLAVDCSYKGVVTRIVTAPNKTGADRAELNFRMQMRRTRRKIDAETS